MLLISDTVEVGGPKGPAHPPKYPVSPVELWNPEAFTKGPPMGAFAAMRQASPIAWTPEPEDRPGFWAVTRYDDVMRVNSDYETFSSQRGGILMSHQRSEMQLARASLDAMINMDAPAHMQLRREHMPYFTPSYLRGLTDRVEGEVTRLLDAMAKQGRVDLVHSLSAQLPLFTLCEILGVPLEDRPKFLTWMHYLELANSFAAERAGGGGGLEGAAAEVPPEMKAFLDAFTAAIAEMFEYGRHMLHKRRLDPQADLMSAIAKAQVDGDLLSDEYLDGSWLLIVFAGNDTTRNTISGSMQLLSDFPEEKAKLLARPELIPGAVNEFIRMISPVIYMRRTATRDVEVAGQQIAEGEKVIMYYGSANRDASVFPDPDRLDVTRANADKHIAFGYGPHTCIGKRVAQLQLEAVYRQMLARFPDIHQSGPMDVAPNNFVYAIRSMPVEFTPEA
ncbi:cytochrome P450 [Phenylobacterium sp.]|uniref:cytochrome P450 n=1 Tax=Phenylobacterium sp. TaxID=1871053 RepID=UPI003BA97859